MTLPLQKPRVQSIDLLRGLVMIIMALDHSRDFFHAASISGVQPLDFANTSPILFFTRWITHFCAPVFVFLSGTSVYFVSQRKSKPEVSRFLITRGLWLMLMELTIVNTGWVFNLQFSYMVGAVIWVLGLCMIVLALLIHLPRTILLFTGLIIVFGYHLLDRFDGSVTDTFGGFIYSVLHVPHEFKINEEHTFLLLYPLIPWVGVMALGYIFGELYRSSFDPSRRKKILVRLGMGCIALFILLRSKDFYGEPLHWETQSTDLFTFLSFINTSKYPPSLLYLLMTIGPSMIFLAFTENWRSKLAQVIIVFGRVPFFYYLLHIFLLHSMAYILFFATGHHLSEIVIQKTFGSEFPAGFGVHLWQTYLLWIVAVALLYFPCRWYNNYKSKNVNWWLSYL